MTCHVRIPKLTLEIANSFVSRYWPLSGELKYMQSIWDFPTLVRMTHIGRGLVHRFVGLLEMARLAPRGTQKTADSLAQAADCLVAGGRQHLFTPMYMMVGRKPEKK